MSKYAFELKWFPIPDGVPNLSEDLFDLIGVIVCIGDDQVAIFDEVEIFHNGENLPKFHLKLKFFQCISNAL